MASNRPAPWSADPAAALRQRFAERESGSLESLSRIGRARLQQKLSATPVNRHPFMVPLASGLAGLAIIAAAVVFHPAPANHQPPVQTASHATPASPITVPVVAPVSPVVTSQISNTSHQALRPPHAAPPAPHHAVPPALPLQAASAADTGAGVEPVVRMTKTGAGIALSWAAAGGEKFIVSKTCYADHDYSDSPLASRVLLVGSGEWTDTTPDAAGCDQTRYEVKRVA